MPEFATTSRTSDNNRPIAPQGATRGLWAAGLFGVALLAVFYQTTWSMVSIWIRSETYAHGFLILPIALWLVWERRHGWQQLQPTPAPLVALLLLPLGALWLVAHLVDVLVIQQLALVAILVVGVWAIVGHAMARALAFPLGFLFLAVPMGEALVPPMMEFTATSTVWLIQLTGIPVYREGLYFTLPSGNWSVIEACSGVRYLIASLTLGILFAGITYKSTWRRAAFILAAIIVPVLANTVRAYMIVMLGHLSGMTIATGVDHLIYGWVFFGVVMLLLFWVGSLFREDLEPVAVGDGHDEVNEAANPAVGQKDAGGHVLVEPATYVDTVRLLPATLLVLAMAGVWPLAAVVLPADSYRFDAQALQLAPLSDGWRPAAPATDTWVSGSRVSGQTRQYFRRHQALVTLTVQYGEGEDAMLDREVVGSSRYFAEHKSPWRVTAQGVREVNLPPAVLAVEEAILSNGQENWLAWSWYRIGSLNTSNDYRAKVQQVLARLGLDRAGSVRVVLATPIPFGDDHRDQDARQRLRSFMADNGKQLRRGLDRAWRQGP